jgi:hypothetical protein
MAPAGHAVRHWPQAMHSDELIFFPALRYEATSTSMGQARLQARQSVQIFPDGLAYLISAIFVWAFMRSETGQAILQKARFLRNTKASIIAVA